MNEKSNVESAIVYKITDSTLMKDVKTRSNDFFAKKLNQLNNKSTPKKLLDYYLFSEEALIEKYKNGFSKEVTNLLINTSRAEYAAYKKLISLIEDSGDKNKISHWNIHKIKNRIGDYKEILKNYIVLFEHDKLTYGLEFSELVAGISMDDIELKKEAYDIFLQKSGSLSAHTHTRLLLPLLNNTDTRAYAIAKSLLVIKISAETNTDYLRTTELLVELSYQMAPSEWLKLYDSVKHRISKEYQRAEDLLLRHAALFGFQGYPTYLDEILNNDFEVSHMGFNKLIALFESGSLTDSEKLKIQSELKQINLKQFEGYGREYLMICLYQTGLSLSQFKEITPYQSDWDDYSKLIRIGDISRKAFLEYSKELGLLSNVHVKRTHDEILPNYTFPFRNLMTKRNLVEHAFLYHPFRPIIYSKHISDLIAATPFNFPQHEIFIFQQKEADSLNHYISIQTEEALYMVIHKENGGQYDIKKLCHLVNAVLEDAGIQERATNFLLEDLEYEVYLQLYAKPSSLKKFRTKYEFGNASIKFLDFMVEDLKTGDALPWNPAKEKESDQLNILKTPYNGQLIITENVIFSLLTDANTKTTIKLFSREDFKELDNSNFKHIEMSGYFHNIQTSKAIYLLEWGSKSGYKIDLKKMRIDPHTFDYKRLISVTNKDEFIYYKSTKDSLMYAKISPTGQTDFNAPWIISPTKTPDGLLYTDTKKVPEPQYFSYDSLSVVRKFNSQTGIGLRPVTDDQHSYLIAYNADGRSSVISMNSSTGQINWETYHDIGYQSRVLLSEDGKSIEWIGMNGYVELDILSGEKIREVKAPSNFTLGFVYACIDDKVYYSTKGVFSRPQKYGTLGCFDLKTGKVEWTYDLLNSPAECKVIKSITKLDNGKLLLTNSPDDYCLIFDPNDPQNLSHRIVSEGSLRNESSKR